MAEPHLFIFLHPFASFVSMFFVVHPFIFPPLIRTIILSTFLGPPTPQIPFLTISLSVQTVVVVSYYPIFGIGLRSAIGHGVILDLWGFALFLGWLLLLIYRCAFPNLRCFWVFLVFLPFLVDGNLKDMEVGSP